MQYVQEYQEIIKRLPHSYNNFIRIIMEIIRLTDQIFVRQIDEKDGLYSPEAMEWIAKNPNYQTSSYSVLRVENGSPVEVPYHVHYKNFADKIILLLEDATKSVDEVEDNIFDKKWWKSYLSVLQEGYGQDRWDKVEQYFLTCPEDNSLLLSIGPIDEYHDKIKGRKRLFSAWLLLRKDEEQSHAASIWDKLVGVEKSIKGTTFYGIPFKTNPHIKLYVGDLIYGGGEVSKFDSMGWSRPQNAAVYDMYGSIKIIAYNKFQEHTQNLSNDIDSYAKKWDIPSKLTQELKNFNDSQALIPLILHEYGHTFLKSEKARVHLEELYPFIEETRANTNMLHLANELERKRILPKDTARNIFLLEFFKLRYLYEGYTQKHQREAYLYAALLWLFIAREYGLIAIEDNKFTIYEKEISKNLSNLTLDVRTFLYTVSYFGSDKDELLKHKQHMFSMCDEIAKQLSL